MSEQTYRYEAPRAQRLTMAEMVDELVLGFTTREVVERPGPAMSSTSWPACEQPLRWVRHRVVHAVQHAPLLEQLSASVSERTQEAGDSGRTAGPRVVARLDALAALQRVDLESRWWLARLGRPVPPRVQDRLLELVRVEVLAREVLDKRDRTLVLAVTSWRTSARVITAWDTPPWSPNVPCPRPHCEKRGSLRVRLDTDTGTATAACVECGSAWDEMEVDATLRHYVAWATAHLNGLEHRVQGVVDGKRQLVQCEECLPARNAMADRALERHEEALRAEQEARAPQPVRVGSGA